MLQNAFCHDSGIDSALFIGIFVIAMMSHLIKNSDYGSNVFKYRLTSSFKITENRLVKYGALSIGKRGWQLLSSTISAKEKIQRHSKCIKT